MLSLSELNMMGCCMAELSSQTSAAAHLFQTKEIYLTKRIVHKCLKAGRLTAKRDA